MKTAPETESPWELTKTDPMNESITKASQTADMLWRDIREAHKASVSKSNFAEILLRDLLAQAAHIKQRLAEMEVGE